jgi:hypothetical protein
MTLSSNMGACAADFLGTPLTLYARDLAFWKLGLFEIMRVHAAGVVPTAGMGPTARNQAQWTGAFATFPCSPASAAFKYFSVVCAAVWCASAERNIVSIDLGWRVALSPPPPCKYPEHVPGYIQSGWPAPGGATTAEACAAAACEANAPAWSFCPGE